LRPVHASQVRVDLILEQQLLLLQFLDLMDRGGDDARLQPAKYREMFLRRAAKGQCVNQPYLGCREFAARFRLVDDPQAEGPAVDESRDLGWMLYDIDFTTLDDPQAQFFRAEMQRGVIDLTKVQVMG
jgi:CRISPR-associated protein Cas5d